MEAAAPDLGEVLAAVDALIGFELAGRAGDAPGPAPRPS